MPGGRVDDVGFLSHVCFQAASALSVESRGRGVKIGTKFPEMQEKKPPPVE